MSGGAVGGGGEPGRRAQAVLGAPVRQATGGRSRGQSEESASLPLRPPGAQSYRAVCRGPFRWAAVTTAPHQLPMGAGTSGRPPSREPRFQKSFPLATSKGSKRVADPVSGPCHGPPLHKRRWGYNSRSPPPCRVSEREAPNLSRHRRRGSAVAPLGTSARCAAAPMAIGSARGPTARASSRARVRQRS